MHALDNVIWQALNTRQLEFALASGSARRFDPEVSPLAALNRSSADGRAFGDLENLVTPRETVGLFLDELYQAQEGWDLVATAPLLEMILESGVMPEEQAVHPDFVELGDDDSAEMLDLTALTRPGPFSKRTHKLGLYLGIQRKGLLVAMTGERLKVPGWTEISAVCTHPDYAGLGYARMLMAEVLRRIIRRGENAFLHVRADNARAIQIYEKLGFRTRVKLHYAVLRKE